MVLRARGGDFTMAAVNAEMSPDRPTPRLEALIEASAQAGLYMCVCLV